MRSPGKMPIQGARGRREERRQRVCPQIWATKSARGLESGSRGAKKRLSNFALGAAKNLLAARPVRRSHTRNF